MRLVAAAAAALLGFALVAGVAVPASAEEAPAWAYRLAHDVMSPFCPGRTLAECPSPQADQLRLWILTQAAAGASQEEVEEAIYARFGDEVRSAPKAEGWGLGAYVIPLVGFVLGAGLVALTLRRLVRRSDPAANAPPVAAGPAGGDPELERLLDDELGAS